MAQYRAIFQNAYFKGLATAAVVTMGLAAGQAQAGSTDTALEADEISNLTGTVEITGGSETGASNKWKNITISAADADLTLNANVVISGGTVDANKINLGATASANKSLTIQNLTIATGNVTDGLTISGTKDKGEMTVIAKAVTVETGTLKLALDNNKVGKLEADSITVGKEANSGDPVTIADGDPTAVISVAAGSTLGKAATTYQLYDGAQITLEGDAAKLLGKSLASDGGKLVVKGNVDFVTPTVGAEKLNINVDADKTLSVKLPANGTERGVAHFASGSTINLASDTDTSGTLAISGATDSGSLVILDSGVNLTSTGDDLATGGVISVTGVAATALGTAELQTDADVLGKFLAGSTVEPKAAKGGVTLAANSKLTINNKDVVLGADSTAVGQKLELALNNTAAAGKVAVTGAATIAADNLSVVKNLTSMDTNLSLVADKLTLGSADFDSNTNKFGFKTASAKSELNFVSKTDGKTLKLQDAVTLHNVDSDNKALAGQITGDVILAKALDITGGDYTYSGDMAIGSASDTAINVKTAANVDKANLDFNGKLSIDRANASQVTASGTDSGEAFIDLSDATIEFANDTPTSAITFLADKNATIKVDGQNVSKLIKEAGASNGALFHVNNDGKLDIVGGLELQDTSTQLGASASTTGIKFTKGSVVVGGELVLRKADTINLGVAATSANLKAASLDAFKNTATSTSFKSGTFTFTQGLNTDAANGFILDSGSVMKLGDFVALDEGKTKWKSENETGSINKDLVLKADGVTLDIVAGDWDAKKVTVTSGTLIVGNDGSNKDVNGDAIKSSLTTTNLIASSSTPIEVTKQGTLKTTEITVDTGSINVSGNMSIAGKYTAGTGGDPDSFGISLKDDAISLKAGSTLTLGADANYALGLADASGTVDSVTVNDTVFDAAGSLKGDAFSTVKLSLADGVVLTANALQDLKTGLFGNESTVSTIDIGAAKIDSLGIKTDEEGNKTLDWSAVDADIKNVLPTYKDAELAQTTILIDSGENVFGHVGAVKATGVSKNGSVTVSNHGSLNSTDNVGGKNLFAYNEKNEAVGLSVSKDVNFALVNGGEAGKVTLAEGSALLVDGGAANGKTVLAKLDGNATSKLTVAGDLNVTGDATLGKATSKEGAVFTVGGNAKIADVAVLAGSTSVKGNLSTKNFTSTGSLQVSGTSTFDGETKLAGNNTLLGDVAFNAKTTLEGQNTLGATTFKVNSSVAQGQTFAKEIKLSADTVELSVGQDKVENTLPNGSTANLVADKLTLAGGTLYADPTFNLPRTIVVAGELTDLATADKDTDAGTLDGKAVALRNSIIALGVDTKDADGNDAYQASVDYVKNTFAPLFEADQSLQSDGIGAIAYVNKKLTMGTNSKIVVDPSHGIDGYKNANAAYKAKIDDNEIYLGTGAALAVDANALNNGAAISFDKATNASVYAEEKAKVLVVGNGIQNKNLVLFENTNTTPGADVKLQGHDLAVESINGLFKGKFQVNQSMKGEVELELDRTAANKYLSSVSAPVQDTLLAAAYGMHNYEEYEAAKKNSTEPKFQEDSVLGNVAEGFKVVKDKSTQNYEVYYGDQVATAEQLKEFNIDKDTSIELAKKNPAVKEHVVYVNTKNDLLDNILYYDGNAVDAETNARLAVFGGAPQAAIEAGASTYEAISARMGVGVSGVSAAANGQGGAIWVTPVYKSADADGFNADNKSYGADVKIYGLALGADIEVAPNFKVGGMFNVGSGDADGQGLGSNVSNDFDYYGLGLYAGYSMDAFSLVADVTYTAVDNDIEGSTDLGKVTTSIDSTNLSVGVTGQYKLSLAGMDVTPHAGLRYSMIDMDDYSTAYSQNDSDSINIFSIPVGVTIAKEYVTDTWTVKPSFDLTLTGNFGDDEVDATAKWNGYSNLSTTVKSEIMDNFTYGAAVGVSATSGNFGLGLGVNYTGSSNTDEFGVNANARYMF